MLRIGDRDPASGMYWVLDETGATLGLGRKQFDEATEPGDKVTGQLRADGVWVLIGRDATTTTTDRRKRGIRPPTHDDLPVYRQFDKFNVDEEVAGDYDQMRISITNRNILYGAYLPLNPPTSAGPVHCTIQIGNRPLITADYPGISSAPTPCLFGGSLPIAWIWGEEEGGVFPWNRIVLVIDLKRARSSGLGGRRNNPLDIEIEHRIEAGEILYYPGWTTGQRRGAPISIWRVGFARKIDGRYIDLPSGRSPEWLEIRAGGGNLWHSGTPTRLGRSPQGHARTNFTFFETSGFPDPFKNAAGDDTLAQQVSKLLVRYPTHTINTAFPTSVASGRGFMMDYSCITGYMLPENPLYWDALGFPFPNSGSPDSRTLRTILLPPLKPKQRPPADPAFTPGYPARYYEYHTFPQP